SHPKFSDLMRAVSGWPGNMRDPGALTAEAHIAQAPEKTTVSDAKIAIGRERASAVAEIAKVDGRTHVSARITDIAMDLDKLLPPAAPAPAAAKPGRGGVAASPWSQEEVTWSFLKGWNGEVSVAGSAFAARGVALQDFSARIVVADDAAELTDWQGKIFGAPGQLFLRLAATPEPSVQGQLAVTGADFRGVVAAIDGGRTSLKSSGPAAV